MRVRTEADTVPCLTGQLAEVAIGDHIVLEPPFDSVLDIGDDIFNVFFVNNLQLFMHDSVNH